MPHANAAARRLGVQSVQEMSSGREERGSDDWNEFIAACRRYGTAVFIAVMLLSVWAFLGAN